MKTYEYEGLLKYKNYSTESELIDSRYFLLPYQALSILQMKCCMPGKIKYLVLPDFQNAGAKLFQKDLDFYVAHNIMQFLDQKSLLSFRITSKQHLKVCKLGALCSVNKNIDDTNYEKIEVNLLTNQGNVDNVEEFVDVEVLGADLAS
jgi:hypothetical protein